MLLNGAGFYIFYFHQLHSVKREMRQALKRLPDDKLERIVLPSASFQDALVEEDEMRWNDRMYDIARIQKRGGDIVVFCLRDQKEENLIDFIGAVLTNPLKLSDVPPSVVQFLSLSFIVPSVDYDLTPDSVEMSFKADFALRFPEIFPPVNNPPPEVNC